MYLPLVKAFNYALDRLSGFDVPGLPEFQEKRQIVFARNFTRCIKSESYLQGSYKPDIILVKWDTFKRVCECDDAIYSKSYKSNVCSESSCDQPSLSWRNILSTLEVKPRGLGDAGHSGNEPPKGKVKQNLVKSTYTGDFGKLRGDLEAVKPPKLTPSTPFNIVDEDVIVCLLRLRLSSYPH